MNNNFLTTKTLVKALFLDLALKTFNKKSLPKTTRIIKRNTNIFVEKQVSFSHKGLSYIQLQNEASMLHFLSKKLIKSGISIPKVKSILENKNNLTLHSEFLKGKQLKTYQEGIQFQTLKKCLSALAHITFSNKELRNLPKRPDFFIGFTYPFYLIISIIKNPSQIIKLLQLTVIFYQNFFIKMFQHTDYVLTHKDLSGENILLHQKRIILIDPEVTVLANPQTDISTVARYYSQDISYDNLRKLISQFVYTNSQKKNFIALTIFYSLQMLTIEKKNSKYYNEANYFIKNRIIKLIHDFQPEKLTIGDRGITLALKVISILNSILNISSKKSFILCYHSIENDSWEFSTKIEDFKNQIMWLRENYNIVSLSELVTNPGARKVAITFDDGYRNVLQNAVPLLQKYKVPATFFVIGNPLKSNKKELNNTYDLLSFEEIKNLSKSGFEIGYHTNTHSNLFKLSSSELQEEIITGKKRLEKKLGLTLNHFAYPRGHYSNKIIELVKKAGFNFSFTVDGGSLPFSNSLLIPRYSVSGNSNFSEFKTSISDLGLLTEKAYMWSLKNKDRFKKYYAK